MPQTSQLVRYKSYEIFSHSTGIEIREAVKNSEEDGQVTERVGRILLRFFKLTPKTSPDEVTQIRFICEPDEAFELGLLINQVANSTVPCKEKLHPHKFSFGGQGSETVTTVSIEKWERSGKSGYALTIGRGKDFISVPVPLSKFIFAAEFLKFISTEQCWVERPDKRPVSI
ncbi:MAG: hypothetical protein A2079_06705 [Geobacteraceae bacterium GWC2_48_7]|nr:MAG: hypothetical protein A2079_06705 [Geobacteraceae bacterium GWC2_48_7]